MSTEKQVQHLNDRDVVKPLDNHQPIAGATAQADRDVVKPLDNHQPIAGAGVQATTDDNHQPTPGRRIAADNHQPVGKPQ
ncbi:MULTISPECIES: hypothetical protein [Streptomyces]|uniref:hypothetical protein n=1 Tax=Streptomyces TaxID=1883 RepID=UPI0025528BC1|nr:hypothetical protein [Streptomyces sp. NBRC 13847]